MKSVLKVHLRRNERLFLNGAVLRPDRKVTLEFLNDVKFLLEAHVLQEEEATTPLRQLYFIIQSMQMEPATADMAKELYNKSLVPLTLNVVNRDILDGLMQVNDMVKADRVFEAMKVLRRLFEIEDQIMGADTRKEVA